MSRIWSVTGGRSVVIRGVYKMCRVPGHYGPQLQSKDTRDNDWIDVSCERLPLAVAPSACSVTTDTASESSDMDDIDSQLSTDDAVTSPDGVPYILEEFPETPETSQEIMLPSQEDFNQSSDSICLDSALGTDLSGRIEAAYAFDDINEFEDEHQFHPPTDAAARDLFPIVHYGPHLKLEQQELADLNVVVKAHDDEGPLSSMNQEFSHLALNDNGLPKLKRKSKLVPESSKSKNEAQDRISKLGRARTMPNIARANKPGTPSLRRMGSIYKRSGLGKVLNKGVTRMLEATFRSGCKVLHFFGNAGSGKTQYLNSFIRSQDNLIIGDPDEEQNSAVIATVSLKNGTRHEPTDILLEVAVQIEEQCGSVIAETVDREYFALDKPVSLHEIRNLWKRAIRLLCSQRDVIVIIDGIMDEEAARNQEPALKEIVQLCLESSRMKCVISSRSRLSLGIRPEVSGGLVSVLDLNRDEEIRTLMKNSISYELHKVYQEHRIPLALTKEIETFSKTIVEKSNGIFVCAELFLRHAIHKITSNEPFEHSAVPNVGLGPGARSRAYTYMLDQVPAHSLALTKEMCSWAICSNEGLTPSHLADILILKDNPNAEPIKRSDEGTLRFCENKMEWVSAHLMKIERGVPAQFVHASVRDYLLSSNSRFSIPAPDAHETVALTQINYLSNANINKDLSSDCEQRKVVCEYIVTSLPDHCRRAEEKGSCLPAMQLNFMEKKFPAFQAWAKAYDRLQQNSIHRKLIPTFVDGEVILMCATFGFAALTSLLLERGRNPNGMCYDYNYKPSHVAEKNGYPQLASMLLHYGSTH